MSIKLGSISGSIKVGNLSAARIQLGQELVYATGSIQYWTVKPCGGSTLSNLAIDSAAGLIIGNAVRPTVEPGSIVRLPGYETGCYELVATASSGKYCGIRAPALNCSQSVCL